VKSAFSILLAVLLLACPQFCRAESLGCCADRCEDGEASGRPQLPEPIQDEAVSCICAGAVRDSESRAEAKIVLGDWDPPSLPPVPAHVSWAAPAVLPIVEPPERAAPGRVPIHLLLQTFRC